MNVKDHFGIWEPPAYRGYSPWQVVEDNNIRRKARTREEAQSWSEAVTGQKSIRPFKQPTEFMPVVDGLFEHRQCLGDIYGASSAPNYERLRSLFPRRSC
ncbi:hypothetical protein NicSoilB11_31490 [Arthrobacter sp. NicSoilB11]|nr:hypothetical protein NicSoilB11_31490 [Arthrobacter sp. NicSoilB11]